MLRISTAVTRRSSLNKSKSKPKRVVFSSALVRRRAKPYSTMSTLSHREISSDNAPKLHVYPTSPSQFTSDHVRHIVASGPFPAQVVSWIRSDHAGETGAVWIYKGALAGANLRSWLSGRQIPHPPTSPLHSHSTSDMPVPGGAVKSTWELAYDMIYTHLVAEQQHLDLMNAVLRPGDRSALVGLWKIAGWALGFFPTVFAGPSGLFATVAAVETFVEEHYMAQIILLEQTKTFPELKRLLEACCADEVQHQLDSAKRYYISSSTQTPPDEKLTFYNSLGLFGKCWFKIVAWGSEAAVHVAKKF